MGCDIHARIDAAKENGDWELYEVEEELGRDYSMFGYLAGVRHDGPPVVERRGLPSDIDEEATPWLGDHSHSWLTADELAEALRRYEAGELGYTPGLEYYQVLSTMREIETSGKRARFVFGFDS